MKTEATPKIAEPNSSESPSTPCSDSSYRAYIHVLHGVIWEERETLDLTGNGGLVDAFTVAMAKCQGISKRCGLQTRVVFVCDPNSAIEPRALFVP